MKRILLQYIFIVLSTICFLMFLVKHIGTGGGNYFLLVTIACTNLFSVIAHLFLFYFVYPIIQYLCKKIPELYISILFELIFLFIYSFVVWDLFADVYKFLLILTILIPQMLSFLFFKTKTINKCQI